MTPFFQLVGFHGFLFLMLWLSILAARSLHRSLVLQGRRVARRSSRSLLRSRVGSLSRPPTQDAASRAVTPPRRSADSPVVASGAVRWQQRLPRRTASWGSASGPFLRPTSRSRSRSDARRSG